MTVEPLRDEVDAIARGDVLSHPDSRPEVADQFAAHVLWMSAEPMLPGDDRTLMKIGARTTPASITELKHRIDVNTFDKLAAKALDLNEVGFCNVASTMPSRPSIPTARTGRWARSFSSIAALTRPPRRRMIAHGLRRATNTIHRHGMAVTREAHAEQKHQKPAIALVHRAVRAPANRPSPISSKRSSVRAARIPRCSMATTCVTVSTRT